jgi:DNA-binding CsgD family transcriptional regulator
MPSPKSTLDDLVVAIYDAALDPSSWQQCYVGMSSLVGAKSMLATLQDPAQGHASLLASNLDPKFLQEYATGWWTKDPWALGALRHERGKAYVISSIVPDAHYVGSEIYNDLVRPHADCRFCLGTIVDVDGSLGVMGFHRPSMASDFSHADRHLLQRLIPYIQQSLRIERRLATQNGARQTALAAFDSLSFGLAVVDSACRPLLMNRVAEACLGSATGKLGGRSHQPLRVENRMETQKLHLLVHEATGRRIASAGAMKITRRASDLPLMLLVSPLVGRHASLLGVAKPAALILIQGFNQPVPPERILGDLFGLTIAETKLAELLAQGARLEDVAIERSVKMSTLRSQLKSILQKTDTDRQASLVRLLTQLSIRTNTRDD